jgi:hypothetical protein
LNNSFLLFILSPFTGFIQAFNHYKEDWAKNSVMLFVAFYGFTMVKPEGFDSSAYVHALEQLYNFPISWSIFFNNFFNENGNQIDIYQPLITYLLSLSTNNGDILFFIFGIVFGFFYSRNIWLLLELVKEKKLNKSLWLLLITFVCVIGFWQLNGVRMWTAAHIYFYGTFLYLVKGNKKGILVATLSILVHFSFTLPVGILFFFIFVKPPKLILYITFLTSLTISTLNIDSVRTLLERVVPDFLLTKVNSYLGDDYIEAVSVSITNKVWYIQYFELILKCFIVIMFSVIYFTFSSKAKADILCLNLFKFSLLFLSVANILELLPSGARFGSIGSLFAVAIIFYYYVYYENNIFNKWIVYLNTLLVLFIIISLRISFDTISITSIFGNPIIAIFMNVTEPLIDFIK